MTEEQEAVEHRGSEGAKWRHEHHRHLSMYYRQTPRTTQPGQLPVRQRQHHQATVAAPGRAASREGEPKRGSQSPPQSSTKLPDSAERCEWLSAAMRRAGRLTRRPFSPCFTLVSRTFHARSLLAIIWRLTGLAPSLAPNAANQYKTAPIWIPQQRATPTQCDIHGGLFGGFGGSGEDDRLIR